MRDPVIRVVCVGLALTVALTTQAFAQDDDQAELAKKLSNPIADLVSVPFQMNWNGGVGPKEQTQFLLNVQPVMPFTLNEHWNMIARVIMPFLSQPPLFTGGTADFGISDVLASLFFSPKESAVVWGVGPVLSLPSTSQPTIGTEKWSAGPTAVVLKQQSGWTYGALWNELWSFAGNDDRSSVSQLYLQPFLSYTTKTLWTILLPSESSANWKVSGDDRWTVPVILSMSKLSTFGVFPASYQFGAGVYVMNPEIGPEWKARFALTILLPKKK